MTVLADVPHTAGDVLGYAIALACERAKISKGKAASKKRRQTWDAVGTALSLFLIVLPAVATAKWAITTLSASDSSTAPTISTVPDHQVTAAQNAAPDVGAAVSAGKEEVVTATPHATVVEAAAGEDAAKDAGKTDAHAEGHDHGTNEEKQSVLGQAWAFIKHLVWHNHYDHDHSHGHGHGHGVGGHNKHDEIHGGIVLVFSAVSTFMYLYIMLSFHVAVIAPQLVASFDDDADEAEIAEALPWMTRFALHCASCANRIFYCVLRAVGLRKKQDKREFGLNAAIRKARTQALKPPRKRA